MPTDDLKIHEATVLPDDACPNCGSMMDEKCDELTYSVNGQKIAVEDVPHLRCPACDEVVLRNDEAVLLRQRALSLYRNMHGLLSADEHA